MPYQTSGKKDPAAMYVFVAVQYFRSLLECGVNPPDGEEDESRRVVRVKEFSNRFSRNYLYPLARQVLNQFLEGIAAVTS